MSPSSINSTSAPVYKYLLFLGAASWMAQYLAVKLAQALHDKALGVVQLMNSNGWTVEQIYNLDQSNRIWRNHSQELFAIQRMLTDELGFYPEKSKNILIQQPLIVEENVDTLRVGIATFQGLNYDIALIRRIAERNIFALCRKPEQINDWHAAIQAGNLNPLDNLRMLTRRKNILFPDSKPIALPPRNIHLYSNPPPVTPLPEQNTVAGTYSAPENEASSEAQAIETAAQSAETAEPVAVLPEKTSSEPATTIETKSNAISTSKAIAPPPPEAIAEQNIPKPPTLPADSSVIGRLKLKKVPQSKPTEFVQNQRTRSEPIPTDPPAEDWVDGEWEKTAQQIIETALPTYGSRIWAKFRATNPWLTSRSEIQVLNLQLLAEWFTLPKAIDRPTLHVMFFASILLGQNLVELMYDAPKKKKKPASWEEKLPTILELPNDVLWFRLYVARRLIGISPLDYPRVLLMRWELVCGTQDEYSTVQRFSIPPPPPREGEEYSEQYFRAVAAELRYRKNEAEARNMSMQRKPKGLQNGLTLQSKRVICILASKHRKRFLERLSECKTNKRSLDGLTQDDARWLLHRVTKPQF